MRFSLLSTVALSTAPVAAFQIIDPNTVDANVSQMGVTSGSYANRPWKVANAGGLPVRTAVTRASGQNTHKFLHSDATTRPNSITLHQDGNDVSYFAEVEVGSNKKKMMMLLDTGAASTWLMSDQCPSTACQSHDTIGSSDSSTFEPLQRSLDIAYGTGSVKGSYFRDTLSLGGLTIRPAVGLVTAASDDFNSFSFDGILGLSRRTGDTDSFISRYANGDSPNKAFSFLLNRAPAVNGVVTIGVPDQALYRGSVQYIETVNDKDWSIPMDSVHFGASTITVKQPAHIDTGTSYIYGPKQLVSQFHHAIPNVVPSADGVSWGVPCDTKNKLAFTFGGRKFEVASEDWIAKGADGKCFSRIYGQEIVAGGWLVGDAFIKNYYTVFDLDRSSVGFAQRYDSATPVSEESEADDGSWHPMNQQGPVETRAIEDHDNDSDGESDDEHSWGQKTVSNWAMLALVTGIATLQML